MSSIISSIRQTGFNRRMLAGMLMMVFFSPLTILAEQAPITATLKLSSKAVWQEDIKTEGQLTNEGTLTFCERIDDDLNPIGAATTFAIGSNLSFLVNLPKPNGTKSIGFIIIKLAGDGKDAELINQYQIGVDPKWKTIASGEVLFDKPGKYRVYAVDWYRHNQNDNEIKEYLAKQELTIK